MTLPLLAGSIILLLAVMAWLAIWSRRDTHARWVAVLLFILGIPTVAYAGIETLGRHRPVSTYLWGLPAGDHLVLAYRFNEGEAIWLYVLFDDRPEPRPLELPWSTEKAQEIQKAAEEGGEQAKGKLMMRMEPSWEWRPQFHPLPQEALPDKPAPERGMQFQGDA